VRLLAHPKAHKVNWGWRCNYFFVSRLGVGAVGEELVNEADLACRRRNMKGGLANLQWGSAEAVAG
jgi:hypothetical protein